MPNDAGTSTADDLAALARRVEALEAIVVEAKLGDRLAELEPQQRESERRIDNLARAVGGINAKSETWLRTIWLERAEARDRRKAAVGMLSCSFCAKTQHEVKRLVAGPAVFICDECAAVCVDVVKEEPVAPVPEVAR